MTVRCPCCNRTVNVATIKDALTIAGGYPIKGAARELELINMLSEHGPLKVSELRTCDPQALGGRGGNVDAVYIRRLLTDINRRTDSVVDMALTATNRQEGVTGDDPVVLFYIRPGSDFELLADASRHVQYRRDYFVEDDSYEHPA